MAAGSLAAEAQHVIAASHDAILVLRPEDEVILDANQGAAEIYGLPLDQLIGRSLEEFSDDHLAGREHVTRTLNAKGYHNFERRQRRADGRELFVSIRTCVVDYNGSPAILSLNRDITDQVQLLQRVQMIAAEWQLTVDSIDAAILLLDEEGRICRVNRAARDLAGLERYDEIVDKHIGAIGPEQPWKRTSEIAGIALAQRIPMTGSITSSGRTWEIQVTVLEKVAASYAVAVMRDVTNFVQLEASVRRTEELSELGQLVGGVAHEVRNPLFIISASFEALEMRLNVQDEVGKRHLANLRREIDRLTMLMNDLLEYGRPPNLSIEVGTINEIVAEVVADEEPRAAGAGVALHNQLPNGLGMMLLDRARLIRVFKNLIGNAIEHSSRGNAVTITGYSRADSAYNMLSCSVEDEGAGFAEADLRKIFEPFFTRRKGGTGLGLSIVKRTVELHGGTVQAENRPEGGARITMEFPTTR